MKKILSIILLIALLLSTAIPAIADDSISTEEMSPIINVDAYAREFIHTYIGMNIPNISATDEFFISQGFVVDGNPDENSRTYFLFKNNICVGELIATYINGDYYSTFTNYDIPFITNAYISHVPIGLVTENDSVYIVSSNIAFCIYGINYGNNVPLSDLTLLPNNISLINLNTITCSDDNYYDLLVNDDVSVRLDVPFVGNDKLADGTGICWAASISSICAFRNNDNSPDSAMDVYTAVSDYYNNDPSGVPYWEIRTFEYYGITPVYNTGGMNWNYVKTRIDYSLPIYASLHRTGGNHGVVICGYQSSSSIGYRYIIMDPNKPTYQYATTTSASDTNLTYVSGTKTYTSWRYYMYG